MAPLLTLRGRPAWLRSHLPALDGLRGLAIALVLLFHCTDRLRSLHLAPVIRWGWTGVNLFFVLSGLLITGIILDERGTSGFFGNFYARRALRIWPLYALILPVNLWLCGAANTWNRPTQVWLTADGVPWLYFLLFMQNLMPGLVGTIFPTWSLAIEEQFYVVWAPVGRLLPPAGLVSVLVAVLAAEPAARRYLGGRFTAVNTIYHLDGLAIGALLALALRMMPLAVANWRRVAMAGLAAGLGGWIYALWWGGPYFDTWLAIGFGGMTLLALLPLASAPQYQRALTWPPLRYLGRISYGLYMVHMLVFARLGWIDTALDRRHWGAAGDFTIVAMRMAVSVAAATALWYGFEKPILGLKRRFRARDEGRGPQRGSNGSKETAQAGCVARPA